MISYLLEFFSLAILLYYLVPLDIYSERKHLMISFLGILSSGALYYAFKYHFDIVLPSTIFHLIPILLLFRGRNVLKVFWAFILTGISVVFLFILSDLVFLACQEAGNSQATYRTILEITEYAYRILLILLIPVLFHKRKNWEIMNELERKEYFLIFLFIGISFFCALSAQLLVTPDLNLQIRMLMVFFILTLVISLFVLLVLLLAFRKKSDSLQIAYLQNQDCIKKEKDQYILLQQKNEDLRAFRHDFNNHVLSLQALSANNDHKKLREYILSMGIYQENINFFRTENLIADAITNQFIENLPTSINFQVTGSFSTNTFLQDIDLCTLLSNLLSNAKEAVLRYQASDEWDGEMAEIILDIHETHDSIQMTVINLSLPIDISESGLTVTSKEDQKSHGFGLKNIKQVAEKYHGDATFFYEKDQHLFQARILLLNSKANIY